MSSNSSGKCPIIKPAKPTPDFPLFAHNTGQWCKKINGQFYYFGRWEKPDEALARYEAEKDDLEAGRTPATTPGGHITVGRLADHFIASNRVKLDEGAIVFPTFNDYRKTCKKVIDAFGADRLVCELQPSDFGELRAAFAKTSQQRR